MLTTFCAAALSVVTSKLFPQTLVLAEAAEAEAIRRLERPIALPSNIASNPTASIMNGNYIGISSCGPARLALLWKKLGKGYQQVLMSDTADAVLAIVQSRDHQSGALRSIKGLVLPKCGEKWPVHTLILSTAICFCWWTMMLFMALVINPLSFSCILHCNPILAGIPLLSGGGAWIAFITLPAAKYPGEYGAV